jgi:hypothetical protein
MAGTWTAGSALDLVVPKHRRAAGIRPLRREDLPAVAALYESVVRSGKREAPPGLADYFERTFFDCPWTSADSPSLVYEDAGGNVLGFIGSHMRRLRLDGRVVQVSCGGQLVVDPQARTKAVGAMLFRRQLLGPQDATIADGANEIVRSMWEISGGTSACLKSMTWTRVLQPVRFAGDFIAGKLGGRRLARPLDTLARTLDTAARPLIARRLAPHTPRTTTEPLTPQAMLEHLPELTRSLRCFPDYDEPYLEWAFAEMAQVRSRGKLVRSLVRDASGSVIGWYVYYLDRRLSQVMQIAARRGAAEAVIDDLLHHAYTNGSAAVRGRVEPHLVEPLARRRCLFGWNGQALVYSRHPAVLAVLLSSQCWLERMDGEAWMGHHTEPFA